jgi:hypothetical protein
MRGSFVQMFKNGRESKEFPEIPPEKKIIFFSLGYTTDFN